MLTIFTTAKPFIGHSGVIQRNALQSWKRLHPDLEVILFGDEAGAAEVCAEYGLRHEQHVERHESGLKHVDYLFLRAQQIARYNYLCYSNCDIILREDFLKAFETIRGWREKFLMIGGRWDANVTAPIEFESPVWAENLRDFAVTRGQLQHSGYVDYFVFPKGLYDRIPSLVIGRSYWDHWLVWKASSKGAALVDATPFIVAVHQNHDYGYHPDGKRGTDRDELAVRNKSLSGNGRHLRSVLDATHALTREGTIRRKLFRPFVRSLPFGRVDYGRVNLRFQEYCQSWINRSFEVRNRIGLRRETLRKLLRYERQSPR